MNVCYQCGKEFEGRKKKYCSTECQNKAGKEKQRKEVERIADSNRRKWLTEQKRFEVLSKWESGNTKIKLKCPECGEVFERPIDSTRRQTRCPSCWRDPRLKYGSIEAYQQHRKEEWEKNKEKREAERKAKKEAERKAKMRKGVCVVCGKTFETLQPSQKTCSKTCSKTYKNYKNDHRINKDNIVDKDITLATLYERDKGICYICKRECDWNDKEGFAIGKTYPTIEHLIPLARGGKHSWNNVKLACHECNSKKSAVIPDNVKELIPPDDIAYALAHPTKSRRKQVKQFTRDGKLVAVYESTADVERKTGMKAKSIQNCARGEMPTAYNYKWAYA